MKRSWRGVMQPPYGVAREDVDHPLYPTLGFSFVEPWASVDANERLPAIGRLARERGYIGIANYSAGVAPIPMIGAYGSAVSFDGIDDQLLPRTIDNSPITWGLVMSATNKSIVFGMTFLGTAVAAGNAYSLPGVVRDGGGGYMGVHRGNRSSEGDAIYCYNWDGGEHVVRMPFTLGAPVRGAYTHDGVVMKGFLNGTRFPTTSSGSTDDTSGVLQIGTSDSATKLQGSLHFVYMYDRALTDDQALEVTENPWSFYVTQPRRSYSIPTGAPPVTGKPWTYQRMMAH